MRPARIEVEIEELVFHGFSSLNATRASEALQRELTVLLSDPKSPASPPGGDRAVVRAPAFSCPDTGRSDVVGSQIAKAVHNVWTR